MVLKEEMEQMVHRGQSWGHHQEHLVMELQDHHQEDILAAAVAAAVKYMLVMPQEELEAAVAEGAAH